MNLNYITTLKDEEWIALINFSMQHHCRKKGIEPPKAITWVERHQEPNRKDLNGNQYVLINTGDGIHTLDTYRASDFHLCTQNVGLYGEYPPIVLDQELRIFLATRFKEAYVKSFGSYLQKQIDEELAMLAEYTTITKEK